jgi:hypothetical protein
MPKQNKRVRRSRTCAEESIHDVNSNVDCQQGASPSSVIHDHATEPHSTLSSVSSDASDTRHSTVFTHDVERMDQVKSIIEHFLTHCHHQLRYRQILYLTWSDEVRTTTHPSIVLMIDPM